MTLIRGCGTTAGELLTEDSTSGRVLVPPRASDPSPVIHSANESHFHATVALNRNSPTRDDGGMSVNHDLQNALGTMLVVGDRLRAVLAARCGLTTVESTAMSHLGIAGPLTQRQLGDRVGLSTGAVTGLVDRLERHGVCRREPHPTDRRSSFVTLTARGRSVLAQATDDLVRAADAVPAPRRAQLAADLESVTEAMSEAIGLHRRPAVRSAPRPDAVAAS